MELIFDIETDGFLNEVTKLHCIVIKDAATGDTVVARGPEPAGIGPALRMLMKATRIIGHNIIKYDIPVLQKLYPWFKLDGVEVFDTLIASRLLFSDLMERDSKLLATGKLPGKHFGSHALEAWGFRLGILKGEYMDDCVKAGITNPWAVWSQAMEDYCVQDVAVTEVLLNTIRKQPASQEALDLEHQVAWIIARQERHGFMFDKKAALVLLTDLLKEKERLESLLKQTFTPMYLKDGPNGGLFTPKKDLARLGYTAGAPVTKVVLTEFNPGSRDHITLWLRRRFGWIPSEYTKDGKPKADETTLADLPWPEVKLLVEYLTVTKRLGQLYEGDEAWFKHERNGYIHGGVNSNGAVTGRMTHSKPNIGQVPACSAPWGKQCRALFTVPEGKELVGADADALELRDLAGYMAHYDGGAYIKTVLEGKKEDGTDMHSINCRALGMDPKARQWDGKTGRDVAKTWFYAFIYGAGDEKLGFITTGTKGPKAVAAGRNDRARFLRNLKALGKLVEAVKDAAKARGGYLIGLDGRHLRVRGQHSALNTLLQSAGALQMKRALVILDKDLQDSGLAPGKHYEFVANVHDEWQIECDIGLGEQIGKLAIKAIEKAGESFGFKCPLAGAYSVGRNWAETH